MKKYSGLFRYLSSEQKGLIEDSYKLLRLAKRKKIAFTDYSFLVFPAAKSYEGFLKKLFLGLGIITEDQYKSDHFRIGKALNPFIEPHLKTESFYNQICSHFGVEVTNQLWDSWKKGRDLIFHYFPHRKTCLDISGAEQLLDQLLEVMDKAVKVSRICK